MPIDAVDPRDERAEQGQDLSVGTTQGTDVGQEQRLVDHPFGQRAKDEATVGLVTRIARQTFADEHPQQALDVVARERGHLGQKRVYLGWPRPAGCSKSPKQLLGVHGTSSGRKSVGRACATRTLNYRMFAGFLQSQGDVPALKLAQRDAVARVECLSTTESTEHTEPGRAGRSDSPSGRSLSPELQTRGLVQLGFAGKATVPEAPTPSPDGTFRRIVRSSILANPIGSTAARMPDSEDANKSSIPSIPDSTSRRSSWSGRVPRRPRQRSNSSACRQRVLCCRKPIAWSWNPRPHQARASDGVGSLCTHRRNWAGGILP